MAMAWHGMACSDDDYNDDGDHHLGSTLYGKHEKKKKKKKKKEWGIYNRFLFSFLNKQKRKKRTI